MTGILIDENLPARLNLPTSLPIRHVSSLGASPTDFQIWEYAKAHDLVILTKDSDFSFLIGNSSPPPRVVHIRIGNKKLNELKSLLMQWWPKIEAHLRTAKLMNVYADRIEVITSTDD